MTESNKSGSEEVLALVAKTLGEQNAAMTGLAATLKEQNKEIAHQPSKRDVLNMNLIATVAVIIGLIISTTIAVNTARTAAQVGQQNQTVVTVFCNAQPALPECTNPGSPTAKAASILTACRIYATLLAATPAERRQALDISEGCKALGFNIPTK
jgi:hypothetical protein